MTIPQHNCITNSIIPFIQPVIFSDGSTGAIKRFIFLNYALGSNKAKRDWVQNLKVDFFESIREVVPAVAARHGKECDAMNLDNRDKDGDRSPGGARVLVVDDDRQVLASIAQLLGHHGHSADMAATGEQACQKLTSTQFAMVLLDLRLPDMHGQDVMTFMHQRGINTAVVVISSDTSFDAISRALRRGAYDYLRKPYDAEELTATVASVLETRHLEDSHEEARHQLRQSEQLHRYIVNSSPDIVFMLDYQGHFQFLNTKVETLLGYKPADLQGRHIRHLIEEQDLGRVDWAFRDPTINADNPRTIELRLKSRGSVRGNRHFEITAFPVTKEMEHGQAVRQIYGTARDITERKEAEAFINFQAYHDLLTRLPNRALFKDRLGLSISQAERNNQKLAVMFIDLDRFKVINDSLGHAMGDRLLQAVTQRLEGCLRQGDTLSRFGGDEFTLLLPEIHNSEDARTIARKLMEALRTPFKLGEHEVFVGVSIGIAMYPDSSSGIEDLIQQADVAMYHVKGRGKDGYQFFSESMNVNTTYRLGLERDLRRALQADELRVHYQPQICLRTGLCRGIEALIRWQHPSRGLLHPGEFLPLAEETRLIGDLSEWVLATACRELGPWLKETGEHLRLSVNFSPMQVEHPRFVDLLIQKLHNYDLPPEKLEIEITENMIINDLEQISRKLDELSSHGVHIAIDDFGTGYSSLNYLHRLPIHTLKVDQSFVRDIRQGNEGACIVNAIIAMARGLRLDIVAEGVETEGQLNYLRELGCDSVQGFYFGDARPIAQLHMPASSNPNSRHHGIS